MTGNYQLDLAEKRFLEENTRKTARALRSIPGVPTNGGITPDSVKFSDAYQQAKKAFDAAFRAQRKFNSAFFKLHKRQYAAERRAINPAAGSLSR